MTGARIGSSFVAAAIAVLSLLGCAYQGPAPFTEAQVLGSQTVDAATLNAGRRAFSYYCRACHGDRGDARGPAGRGLRTPPRDFRIATYKFAGVPDGALPSDDALARVIRAGLHGTAMLEWDIPEQDIHDIVQYIKTFSPEGDGWRDPDNEQEPSIDPGEDPWDGRADEAVARGRAVYHGRATCYSCHPSYETRAEINADRASFGQQTLSGFRGKMWLPEPKASEAYLTPLPDDPTCESADDCEEPRLCHFGRCELPHRIIPPDFTVNELRVGSEPAALYRIIASGVPGTAMPTWEGSLPPDDIWAMAHYVHHLATLSGSAQSRGLKERVRADAPDR